MNPRLQALLAAAAVVLAGVWVYAPALRGGWIWDDTMYFGSNHVLALPPAAALRRIWSGRADVSYFPITASARWLEWRLWGPNMLGYHAAGLGLHLLSALLFWHLLRKLRIEAGGGSGFGVEWLAALLFAVHPVCVESVAWISELKNTLSLPLLLLAMIFYIRWSDLTPGRLTTPPACDVKARWGQRAPPYLLSLFCFTLAMLAKSTVAMLPACLLLYVWWRRGRIGWNDLAATAPYFGISLALGLVTVWFEHHVVVEYLLVAPESILTRLAGAGIALVFYLGKAIFPAGTVPIYPLWRLAPLALEQCLPWLALAAAAAWLASLGRRGRDTWLGLGWFALSLAPMLGLIGLAYLRLSRVADHFAYLALLGAIGWAVMAVDRWRRGGGPVRRAAAGLGAAAAVVLLGLEAHARAGAYRDEPAFWTETLRRNPEAWLAHYDLGNILLNQGRLAEAMDHYRAAARINPRQSDPQANWGVALIMLGRPAEAVPHLEQAVRLDPEAARVENSLGMALMDTGRPEEAIRHYRRAVELEPRLAEAWNNLGRALDQAGRLDEAIVRYQEAVRLRPDNRVMRENLAHALSRAGRMEEALDQFERVRHVARPDGP